MSLSTMLIMGLTANNAKVQFKSLVKNSQTYIHDENKSRLTNIVSKSELAKYSNLAIQKANKTAFHLSNHLTFNKIFGSVRDQMLQQTRTRIFEYAFKAKFPASQESISLIYPRARMYSILEQDLWTTYKGKNNINQIFSSFIWISGFIAVLSIWPFFKTHSSNQRFVPERFTTRKRSILPQLERRTKNSWDTYFLLNKKAKDHLIFLNILPITNNNISSPFFTIISKSNISQTKSNFYITSKKDLNNDKYIKVSKKILHTYSLQNGSKQIKSQILNQFRYWDPFSNKNLVFIINLIILFSRKLTQVSLKVVKSILYIIGTLMFNIKYFITNKNNIYIQYIRTISFSLLQSILQILNTFSESYNLPVQNVLLDWKNQLQKRIHFNKRFIKNYFNLNQIREIIFKNNFWKIKIVKKSSQLKEVFEQFLYKLKFKILIYLTKISLIFLPIKKNIPLKNIDFQLLTISFESTLDHIQKKLVKDEVCLINYSANSKDKRSNLTLQIQIKNNNKLISQRYYKIMFLIKSVNKQIYKFQQIAYKYLKTVFFVIINKLLQNLQKITLLISKKKSKKIASYLETFFQKEKEMHPSIKFQKWLSCY